MATEYHTDRDVIMNRIFRIPEGFTVPDGTIVSPFLNAKDTNQEGVPWDALDGMSIAAGTILAGVESKVHFLPLVTQVTFVISGRIRIRMKEPGVEKAYEIDLEKREAVVTRPLTFLQLVNRHDEDTHVLYLVSPAYIFEKDDETGEVRYDDAIVLDDAWNAIVKNGFPLPSQREIEEMAARRAASDRRLARRNGGRSGW